MKHFYHIILVFIGMACQTTQQSFQGQVNERPRFENISEDEFISIVDADTIRLTTIRFENRYASFKTGEAMYINQGMWDEVIRTSKFNFRC
jgi:hypothetical protein